MKIVVLNGNPDQSNTEFESYLKGLSDLLESHDHKVTTFVLRDMDIRYCVGCFGCWVKTPGECVNADDSAQIRREIVNSDLLIFASPVIIGFTSAVLKRVHDKCIPLVLPYLGIFDGECHHPGRYDSYPVMGLILQPESDTDEEDIQIITDIYERDSLNFQTDFVFSKLTTGSVEEIVDEINGI